jgi:hypothetical protein
LKKAFYILSFCFITLLQQAGAQGVSNTRKKSLLLLSDTIQLDSLSIIPESETVIFNDNKIHKNDYVIDYISSTFIIKNNVLIGKEITIIYRVFPLSFMQSYEHKKISSIEKIGKTSKNPFLFEYSASNEDIFYLNGLNKSGSISRGVGFGNNQDLSVNSSLNLQLSGKVSNTVSILASISDDNIPIQAEGNTQQLQEFDKVFIQLYSDDWKLTAGDFYLKRPNSYFMNFNKKAQGGSFEMQFKTGKKESSGMMKPKISAAVSKGKFAKNKITGVEGNQGPYRLTGAENESFIIVLSGTEKIYIDGKLMKRGNEFDYIIDYNTAEIVFTTKQLITKDKRIVAEFQYSDKNYARSLVHFGNEFKNKKLKLNMNIYSEQDAKNQPLQQDLTDTEKLILSNVGDSVQDAIVPNFNLVAFSENIVLYKMVDTLGIYDSVFVYSTNPDSAKYQLGFSYVGANKGNYIQIQSTANGKVYQWQVPVAGIPQGDYEPIILLVTPKTKQMATFGGTYSFSKNSSISWEGAVSNNDINSFSNKHNEDDIGYAFKVNSDNQIILSPEKKTTWKLNVGMSYEFVDQFFSPIERYRAVEFNRDWNISSLNLSSNQHILNLYTGIEKKKKGNLNYKFTLLNNEGEYEGFKNSLSTLYNIKGFVFAGDASYLSSEGINNTAFLRHKAKLSKPIRWIVIGAGEEFEQNNIFINQSDSLQAGSFQYSVLEAFIHNADTTINKFKLTYRQREDKAPVNNNLIPSTLADDIEFSLSLLKSKNHKFRTKVSYRKLYIVTPSLTTNQPEENILSRVEYVAKFLKRSISTNTYYEIGSGLEVKKEFTFIEVQPGQGTHAYIGDLNGNGVKDLNEFEVAAFQDQADFIKIFTPTNEFVRTFTNQFNQGLFLRPESIWGAEKGLKKMISRFSNRTNYRISRKVSDKTDYYNPFIGDISDSSLVTLNLGFLNTFYFNRTGTKFGADFTFQDNRDRSLLTSGIESRKTLNRALKTRWNITRVYTVSIIASDGVKEVNSEFFTNRNFNLTIQEIEPKISVQPSVKFRASLLFNYKEKINDKILGGEEAISKKVGGEIRYNVAAKGSFRANVNYIENTFTPTNNASLAYEMLEGLQEGVNITWEITFQQNLSKHMQLSLNYNGRKSDNTPIIHVGGVQVRAFF